MNIALAMLAVASFALYLLYLRKSGKVKQLQAESDEKAVKYLNDITAQRLTLYDWTWEIREIVDSFLNDVGNYHRSLAGEPSPDGGNISWRYVSQLKITHEEYEEFRAIYQESIKGNGFTVGGPDVAYIEPGFLLSIIHDLWHGDKYADARDKAYLRFMEKALKRL
jgi:hypothetical protein